MWRVIYSFPIKGILEPLVIHDWRRLWWGVKYDLVNGIDTRQVPSECWWNDQALYVKCYQSYSHNQGGLCSLMWTPKLVVVWQKYDKGQMGSNVCIASEQQAEHNVERWGLTNDHDVSRVICHSINPWRTMHSVSMQLSQLMRTLTLM